MSDQHQILFRLERIEQMLEDIKETLARVEAHLTPPPPHPGDRPLGH